MDVKKCDRCGEVFDGSNQPRAFNFKKSQNVNQICTLNKYGKAVREFDLCGNCVKQFNEWMKGETE